MKFKETTVRKKVLYKGKILSLRVDDVTLPDGKQAVREIVEHHGGSCVLCVRNGKILLVRQYRYAYGETVWEIPAGKLNEGESPEETAARELEEECGYSAKTVTLMFTVYPSPGYTDEIIRIYRAENLVKTHTHKDEDEFLTSRWVSEDKVRKMMADGKIKDGKTLIALLSYFNDNKH